MCCLLYQALWISAPSTTPAPSPTPASSLRGLYRTATITRSPMLYASQLQWELPKSVHKYRQGFSLEHACWTERARRALLRTSAPAFISCRHVMGTGTAAMTLQWLQTCYGNRHCGHAPTVAADMLWELALQPWLYSDCRHVMGTGTAAVPL